MSVSSRVVYKRFTKEHGPCQDLRPPDTSCSVCHVKWKSLGHLFICLCFVVLSDWTFSPFIPPLSFVYLPSSHCLLTPTKKPVHHSLPWETYLRTRSILIRYVSRSASRKVHSLIVQICRSPPLLEPYNSSPRIEPQVPILVLQGLEFTPSFNEEIRVIDDWLQIKNEVI